jgi:hypothetical protein
VFDRGKLESSNIGCSHGVSPAGRQAEMGAAGAMMKTICNGTR